MNAIWKPIRLIITAVALLGTGAAWSQGPQPSKEACAFSVAELEGTLNLKLNEGRGFESAFAGGKSLTCTYSGKGLHGVTLQQTRMDKPGALTAEFDRFAAGSMEPIAADADKARWQVGQGDLSNVTLHYLRKEVQTQLRVSGVNMKNPTEVSAMRARVLKLRRLP